MLENNNMINNVMAIPPWGNTFSFFISFFSLSFFFTLYQERETPVRFHWNCIIERSNIQKFVWKIAYWLKQIKEEGEYIVNPYINLLKVVDFEISYRSSRR